MKLAVRDATFETNSSSSHAVVVADSDICDLSFSKETLRRGLITVNPDRFYGSAWKRFRTPEGKLGYLLVVAAGHYIAVEPEKDAMQSIMDKSEVRKLVNAVRRLTKCDIELIYRPEPDEANCSKHYIMSDARQAIEFDVADLDMLNRFLFCSKSYVETGSDNNNPPLRIRSDISDGHGDGEEYFDATLFDPIDHPSRWFKLQFMPGEIVNYIDDEGYEHAPKIGHYLIHKLFGEQEFLGVVTECELDIKEYIFRGYRRKQASEPDFEKVRDAGRKRFAENQLHWLVNAARDRRANTGDRRMYIVPDLDMKVTSTGETNKPNMSIDDVDRFKVKIHTDDASLEIIRAEMNNAYNQWKNLD